MILSVLTLLAAFLASGAVVVIAATRLARHADEVAEISGIGRLWVGSLLLAGATSLPELTTDVFAVRLGAADLAVGDLFGSGLANMLILAVVDLVSRRGPVLRGALLDHALAACLAISLTGTAGMLVLIRPTTTVLGVGPGALLLLLGYLLGTRAIYRHTASGKGPAQNHRDEHPTAARRSLRPSLLGFALAAVVILAAAPALAWSAKGLAAASGLGNSFMGTWLVGLCTSLPELMASLAALRLGAPDLAIGNLFGSNAFNMAIFFVLDLVHPGPLLASIDANHVISALGGTVLTSLGVAAIVYRAERRLAMIEPSSTLMVLGYVLIMALLYLRTSGG